MVRKILILAGAPETHKLNWDESNLLNKFLDPIAKFARIEDTPNLVTTDEVLGSALDVALWRSIPLEKTTLPTGFSQLHQITSDYRGDEGFFTAFTASHESTSDLADTSRMSQEILDKFYDHSLAIHNDIPSSQLPTLSLSTDESSLNTTEDMSTYLSTQGSSSSARQNKQLLPQLGHLSDLEDLPAGPYLQSISPQTMTVNLIVGIISIAEPRTVKTRWGATRSLVELLVGDETKSGFSVSFWLSAESDESSAKTLKELRRQDIVLLRNVALSVFMKKVHGHSLRKSLTKIDLLYRRKLDRADRGGLYIMRDVSSKKPAHPQLLKTRKVWEWVMNFVGGGGTALGKRKQKGRPIRSWDMPPDDTL
ncbi:uncharacterized protein GGS22DRAFT_154606 [Annulohypoxylon maeteangense]|uniref:uncharacterized protein n=1 Tax=Annulohypoxylon maeteangense TaxID=1927788 RepID=UPI002008E7D4|nr:uncharacterized protein GGS22DRAFT_154606 [Annulohypoxylon maeteangense]KAI0887936.1 hypothetical protein GGS22DRAFT_154606 [Annulohypoxylon maeteangense]